MELFFVVLVPKISVKWSDQIRMIKSGDVSRRNFSPVTISDEAFAIHVLEWYLPHWDSNSSSTPSGVKKKVGRKKSESLDDKKKLENYVKIYKTINEAKMHENRTEWEEAILEELLVDSDVENDFGDENESFEDNPFALPCEPIDLVDWDTV